MELTGGARADDARDRERDVERGPRGDLARRDAVLDDGLHGADEGPVEDADVEGRRGLRRAEEERVDHAHGGAVVLEDADEVLAERDDPIARAAATRDRTVERLGEVALTLTDHGGEQALLAAEVVVEDRLGHAGALDDLADRGRGVALALEERDCRLQEATAGMRVGRNVAARGGGHGRDVGGLGGTRLDACVGR